jgi:hypothetical protein
VGSFEIIKGSTTVQQEAIELAQSIQMASKVGIKIKRLKAGWDNDNLLHILGVI